MIDKKKEIDLLFRVILFATGLALGIGISIIITWIVKGSECIA